MKRLFAVLSVVVLGVNIVCVDAVGAAEVPDWGAGEPVARVSNNVVTDQEVAASREACVWQAVLVRDYAPAQACVTQMNGWRYALYDHFYTRFGMQTSERLFVVGIGTDMKMYVVQGMPTSVSPVSNPGSSALIYHDYNSVIAVYKNYLEYLVWNGQDYDLSGKPPHVVTVGDGREMVARTIAVSRGGVWIAAETQNGIAQIDLANYSVRIVAPVVSNHALNEVVELAISDNGYYVAVAGRLYSGRQLAVIDTRICTNGNCSRTDLTPLYGSAAIPDGWPISPQFGTDGARLEIFIDRAFGNYTQVSVYPYGSAPPSVRYLALGDSFSSGEGDGDPTYYLAHTDDRAKGETCHTSSRSYPFLIAAYAGLNAFEGLLSIPVRSVACSGAKISDVIGSTSYTGQGGRIAGESSSRANELRVAALNDFVPGRIRQQDFVERYQPKALSLSIGGNDVQFAHILSLCARSITTCDYASQPTDRRNLGDSITALYPKLIDVYTQLNRSDPSARIFAVGYPRFINPTEELCPLSINLDAQERLMIDEGVKYLNAVTKAAAATVGIGYLDIEDALAAHRGCDDPGGYVNAIDIVSALFGTVDLGTFHPNELGNEAIARSIVTQASGDLADFPYCISNRYPCPRETVVPLLPGFFGDSAVRSPRIALPSELVKYTFSGVPYLVTKAIEINLAAYTLATGSKVRAEIHSDVTVLGEYRAGTDGALNVSILLPDSIPSGYHTLHLYGQSPSGEELDMYQIVNVADNPPTKATAEITPPVSLSNIDTQNPSDTAQSVAFNTIPALPNTGGVLKLMLVAFVAVVFGVSSLLLAKRVRTTSSVEETTAVE